MQPIEKKPSLLSTIKTKVLFIFVSIYCAQLNAQHFDFGLDFTQDYPYKNQTEGIRQVNSLGFHVTYFPIYKIPIGIITNGNMGRYASFEYSRIPNLGSTSYDTLLSVNNPFYRYCVGLKVSNQNSKFFLNPYISGLIGIGFMNTKFNYSRHKDVGEDRQSYTIEGGKLHRFRGQIYKLEAGLEFNLVPKKDRKSLKETRQFLAFYAAVGLTGSFKNFQYYNIEDVFSNGEFNPEQSMSYNYSTFRENFSDISNSIYNEKLSLWYFSIGVIVKL